MLIKLGYFMIWLPVWLREHYMLTSGDRSLAVVFTGRPFYWRCYHSWNSGNGVTLEMGLYHLGFIICITNCFPSCHLFKFLNSSLHFNVCLPFFIVSTPVQILSIHLQKLRRNPFQILSSLSLLLIPPTPLLLPWTRAACPLGHLIMKRWVG